MAVPFINLRAVNDHLLEDYLEQLPRLFESGQFILGPAVQRFEEQFARFVGARHGIGVNSGTDAVLLALKALKIGPGDEVIIPAFAFGPTAAAVVHLGATPVFVDVRADSYCLDPDLTLSAISSRTKAIIAVHLFGQACEIDRLTTIARTYSVAVIEDLRHATGARFNNRRLGSFGTFGAFSFYPTRNLGAAGDAGLISTNDEKCAELVRKLREGGLIAGGEQEIIGYNSRMDAMQATLLSIKLADVDENNLERVENARRYTQLFKGTPITSPLFRDDLSHVYGHYVVLAPEREKLSEHLTAKGIGHGIYYAKPLHLQPAFQFLNGREGAYPVAEDLCRRAIALPICPGLKKSQIEDVANTVIQFYGAAV